MAAPTRTAVTGLLGVSVFKPFYGSVVAGKFNSDYTDLLIKRASGAPVSAMAVTPGGWLFVGDESGNVLWGNLMMGMN